MFRLWSLSEQDLLSPDSPYTLKDTGQGLQRVQPCPKTYRAMQQLLRKVQAQTQTYELSTEAAAAASTAGDGSDDDDDDETGDGSGDEDNEDDEAGNEDSDYGGGGGSSRQVGWVGSSMIHMGDHNVPNALSFIDKYNQVARILGPIVQILATLEQLVEDDDGIASLVHHGYGGLDELRLLVLHDFFTSAFDGSGAHNDFDAGSCIDGRLTSAWNWCNSLSTKPFFAMFKLAGFAGFDGEFEDT